MSDKKETAKKTEADSQPAEKTCFIIMPIANHPDYASGHFARVYNHIIEPACKKAGFKALLASEVKSANLIIAGILDQVINADMALCDLSSRNPNVLYELALRQAFDLPVALIKDDATREPFDIQGIRYLEYNKELRIDLVQKAVDDIAEVITETYENRDKDIFSLVHILGRKKAELKESTVSNDTLAILEAIKELRPTVNTLTGSSTNPLSTRLPKSAPFQITFQLPGFTEGGVQSVLYYINRVEGVVDALYIMTENGVPMVIIKANHLISELTLMQAINHVGPANWTNYYVTKLVPL